MLVTFCLSVQAQCAESTSPTLVLSCATLLVHSEAEKSKGLLYAPNKCIAMVVKVDFAIESLPLAAVVPVISYYLLCDGV